LPTRAALDFADLFSRCLGPFSLFHFFPEPKADREEVMKQSLTFLMLGVALGFSLRAWLPLSIDGVYDHKGIKDLNMWSKNEGKEPLLIDKLREHLKDSIFVRLGISKVLLTLTQCRIYM